jgi:hypothetical protein
MTPYPARSSNEAHLYMDLRPCGCGQAAFDRRPVEMLVDGNPTVRYSGACPSCGVARTFEFAAADGVLGPAERGWADTAEPSMLLDAGEWLWVADRLASRSVHAWASPDNDVALAATAAAVEEVLKFLPAGAGSVPAGAFWSSRGRLMRTDEPGRFRREPLEAARDEYQQLLTPPVQEEPQASAWAAVVDGLAAVLDGLPDSAEVQVVAVVDPAKKCSVRFRQLGDVLLAQLKLPATEEERLHAAGLLHPGSGFASDESSWRLTSPTPPELAALAVRVVRALREEFDYAEPARLRYRARVQHTGAPLVLPKFGIDPQ